MSARNGLMDEVAGLAEGRLPEDEAREFGEFVRRYYGSVAGEELAGRDALDVYGAARAHWEFARWREPGSEKIRVYNPSLEEHGWRSARTVVEVVNDDMPFLVDSVSAELNRHGFGIHLVIHPLLTVRRDREGRLLGMLPPETAVAGAVVESLIHIEVERQTEGRGLQKLHDCLHRVLREVRAAVEDWKAMSDRLHEAVAELRRYAPPAAGGELEEMGTFLEWLDDHHFTFLGYREYEPTARGDMKAVAGSGLGLLREEGVDDAGCPSGFGTSVELIPPVRGVVGLAKGDARATVHRPSYLDAVSVERLGEGGEVVGERRFVGLYTSAAYGMRPWEVPLLRRKVARVLDRADFPPASHDRKALLDILENYPRDELLQAPEDALLETAVGILGLQERRRVRLFVRPDPDGRFVSCLLYLPREWYDTQAAERVERVLLDALGGAGIERDVRLSESVLVRVYFVVRAGRGSRLEHDPQQIEARVRDAVRPWADDLREELVGRHGEGVGEELALRYGDAFPTGYRADFPPAMGATDIVRLEGLAPEDGLRADLYRPPAGAEGSVRLKLYRRGGPLPLSRLVPLLENLGATVADERPYEVWANGERPTWIYDFGLSRGDDSLRDEITRGLFEEALVRTRRGEAEDDGFNRLVPLAGLGWRQVVLLRAYGKYLRQAGGAFSLDYMQDALAANPRVARALVELFQARLDPDREDAESQANRLTRSIEEDLEGIVSLDEDRILRAFLSLVGATTRTNHFQTDASGKPKGYLSFKLDPQRIPGLPQPKPMFEIFVYSPRMEGVHLRGGRVARGGIRFSDRLEDFRTEVLGLMKAQTVKNSVIVPVGAKGGFVVKQPPADGDREALQEEAVACYRTLIRGMLDLTDNLSPDGSLVPPPGVVRRDGDDPYLVVAADKGTATFSDIANGISQEYGFWLGDAFASGGSSGYDHKAMGITARGAWESVKRHFDELGLDPQEEDFTVVGVGDMAGDVFGNGMLFSRRIKLVGAFDHRHIFLDPDPDPETSYAERQRLFDLPRSSWADYDESLISEGGGVFSRKAKSIGLSPEIKELLDVEADSLTPNEVIRALLAAEVDLLWNGGIGTYVKASDETYAEVGDKANDPVRVDAAQLRCRVVGEGGNLGFTQKGRIEFALAGGRINTDAVDNSAGVDCSDHEVNIKILLDSAVSDGEITVEQRDSLLAEMTEEVAGHVLADNREQNRALANAVAQAVPMADVHARYLRALEGAGKLDRGLERLPDEDELARRNSRGLGLTSPDLSVLLAYAKAALYEELLTSDVPEDGYLSRELARYFPARLRERFADRAKGHRLRRELVATRLSNEVVNRAGTTFVFRLGEETGASPPEVVRAYAVAREVFGARQVWEEIEAVGVRVSPATRTGLFLDLRRAVERASRWLLRNRRQPLDVAAAAEYFSPALSALSGNLPAVLPPARLEALRETTAGLVGAGVPDGLAGWLAGLGTLLPALDFADISATTGEPADAVAAAYFALDDRLGLDRLRTRIEALPREDLWQTLARAALRDDLDSQQAALTAEVLRAGPADEVPGADPATRLTAWSRANQPQVERVLQVLADLEDAGRSDAPSLSVATREIRNLARCDVLAPATDMYRP